MGRGENIAGGQMNGAVLLMNQPCEDTFRVYTGLRNFILHESHVQTIPNHQQFDFTFDVRIPV